MAHQRNKRVLVWKLEGKRPLRRTSRRRETNVTEDRKRIGWDSVDWIHPPQDRKVAGCYAVVIEPSGSM